jgi:hypothetical protein
MKVSGAAVATDSGSDSDCKKRSERSSILCNGGAMEEGVNGWKVQCSDGEMPIVGLRAKKSKESL